MYRVSRRHVSAVLLAPLLLTLALAALPATPVRAAATFIVNSTADPATGAAANCAPANAGTCTLRDAVAAANATTNATVAFPNSVNTQITLNSPLTLSAPMTIQGNGTLLTGITASSASNDVFDVSASGPVVFSGVAITSGNIGISITGTGGVTVTACTLFFNAGAGIENAAAGTLTVMGSSLSGNGRGLKNALSGTVHVADSSISQNTNTGIGGGGILNLGMLTVTNSTLAQNSSSQGGGIYNYGGTLTVMNSTLAQNSSSRGGGIFLFTGAVTVTNSTLAGNSAPDAGGIFNSGTLTVTNSTIAGNSSVNPGGGIEASSTMNATNTLIVDNTGGKDVDGPFGTDSHNIIGSFTFADPDPAQPQDHGGPTKTLALPAGSPAIGAGDPTTCAATTGTNPVGGVDQRGQLRPATVCDIGAYETPGKSLSLVAPATADAGINAPLTVVARDGFGHAMAGYRGTVRVTPSDPASAPFLATFTTADAGSHTFPFAFPTAGVWTVAATDTALTAPTATVRVAPVVANLGPNSGNAQGGGTVAIGGSGFGSGSGVQVAFGTGAGSAATIVQVTNTTIMVRVPAHGAGTVDVTVTVNGVSATKAGAYTYGTVATLPQPQPAGGGSGNPATLPGVRPAGPSSPSGSPNPLPMGR